MRAANKQLTCDAAWQQLQPALSATFASVGVSFSLATLSQLQQYVPCARLRVFARVLDVVL